MRIDEFTRKDMGKREEPISEFIKELQDFLEGASYTLDRIEGEMAVLENRKSKEMIEIPYVELPTSVKEGDILDKRGRKFFLNTEKTKEVENKVQEQFNQLKKDNF